MISLKQLQVFTAIARSGNLTDAAGKLYLSKGAVSQALSELERRLDTPLFDRIHPRLQLNEQGRQLQPLAEELLDRAVDIQNLFSQSETVMGGLRIGASQTIGNYLLPRLLGQLPDIDIDVTITNTHNLCQMLAQFELDIALIEGQNRLPSLHSENWLEDEMLVVAPPGHPLANQPRVTLADLNNQSWVLREPRSGSREQFDQQLAPQLSHIDKLLELNTLEAVMQGVVQGLGLTLISALAASDHLRSGQLVSLAVTQRFPRTLQLVWHNKKYRSALFNHFVALCLQQANNAAD